MKNKIMLLIILLCTLFSNSVHAETSIKETIKVTPTQTTSGYMYIDDQTKENIEILKKHTVIVWLDNLDGKYYRSAGIVIDKRHILTVDHATSITGKNYYYENEGSQPYWLTVIKRDSTNDIALLEIDKDAPDLIDSPMTFAKEILLDESVYTIGHPLVKLFALTVGSVRRFEAEGYKDINCVDLKINISEGNSGGFVINKQGELVGMIFSKSQLKNVGYMIGKDVILKFLE